ncbi:MAG: histidine kinase [Thiobacillus sp.]|nr:histidine kinase [Thiobacillus sp.]
MSKRSQTRLPDFRNLGVILRSFLLVEGGAYLVLLTTEAGFGDASKAFVDTGVLREPVLLVAMASLFGMSPLLGRLSYRLGVFLVLVLVFVSGLLVHAGYGYWLAVEMAGGAVRTGLLATAMAGVMLAYFNCRYRILSPALSEARLMALQARIRPHFLFNSLNTVLGLMREDARKAEQVLENLAELYRALLSEAGTLVPLAKELELARAYTEIEMMRLGDRLRVNWQCQESALDALVPPLILQPLLENAVYHGVEPAESGGEVGVAIFLKGDQLNLVMRNPCAAPSQRQAGNRMALENIRERLDLHFDAEAEMSSYRAGDEFVVQIRMPYKHA